jgi:hypothetical protein
MVQGIARITRAFQRFMLADGFMAKVQSWLYRYTLWGNAYNPKQTEVGLSSLTSVAAKHNP